MQDTVREGLVVRATGSWYSVEHGGEVVECRARGRIRLKGVRSTNPIVVGDRVEFTLADGAGVIHRILPRRNYIIRRSINLSKETHIIAANLDAAYVVVTLTEPATPLEFVDRFLATATAYSIPGVVVLNKQDLPGEREASEAMGMRYIYREAGYEVLAVSATTGQGIEELRDRLAGRRSLIAGNSGVGKSSLVNALEPGLDLKTSPLSENYQLGRHTTTFSEMFRLSFGEGTYVIDTPGIKGFGVVEFGREEISHFFPDIFALKGACRFGNCLHDQEPGCAVRAAVEAGELAPSRYVSYLSLLADDQDRYR
ncbi:MAG: ribosome small subunit-dependent GTPase A [Bacteroidia bacterium]|nr:MAG: ribosome small subunit-dependent GTPase A [Bacteroidia bacterium]